MNNFDANNPYRNPEAEPPVAPPSTEPGIENEPHLRNDRGFEVDRSEAAADEAIYRSETVNRNHVEHTVWDEPGLSQSLTGDVPEDAVTYSRWLGEKIQATSDADSWKAVTIVAAASGLFAVVGTLLWGPGGWNVLMSMVIFGPLTEEIMKVGLSIWVVEKRPYLFKSWSQVLLCTFLSGVAFAAIENLLYLFVYIPNPSPELVLWRWTVCVLLHSGCSLIAGIGVAKVWAEAIRNLRPPQLPLASVWVIAAIVVHGVYNAVALMMPNF